MRFDKVARNQSDAESDPRAAGVERFVGLEHLDPRDLRIRSWGSIADGTTFTRVFRAGQVLFGKRRAYQRKAAVPDFDGVCSGDIYVFAANEKRLIPELLPFLVQSEGFATHAENTSEGSLSPRTKWKYLAEYADLGADSFVFHPEATVHVQRQLAAVRERGMKAGLALNPGTPLSLIEEVIPDLDVVLVMSVNPGFGGQGYWLGATDKIRRLRALLDAAGSSALIEIDGGITPTTIGAAYHAGCGMFVAGTAVFGAPDPAAAVAGLKAACIPGSFA